MYFSLFPKIKYDVVGDGVFYTMTNITRRVKFTQFAKENTTAFDFYDVQDGDTPEVVAFYYYQDIELHWLVLLANNITDVYSQWPMSVPRFEQYVNDKYDDVNAIHHYEIYQTSGDTEQFIQLPNNIGYPNATPVTNYVYEDEIQKKLSRIRLVRNEFVDKIESQLGDLLKG